jgi:hypothetical protein
METGELATEEKSTGIVWIGDNDVLKPTAGDPRLPPRPGISPDAARGGAHVRRCRK